jgi:hypothetical protein
MGKKEKKSPVSPAKPCVLQYKYVYYHREEDEHTDHHFYEIPQKISNTGNYVCNE